MQIYNARRERYFTNHLRPYVGTFFSIFSAQKRGKVRGKNCEAYFSFLGSKLRRKKFDYESISRISFTIFPVCAILSSKCTFSRELLVTRQTLITNFLHLIGSTPLSCVLCRTSVEMRARRATKKNESNNGRSGGFTRTHVSFFSYVEVRKIDIFLNFDTRWNVVVFVIFAVTSDRNLSPGVLTCEQSESFIWEGN